MSNFQLSPNTDSNKIFLRKRSELENRLDPHQYHPERLSSIAALFKNNQCLKLKHGALFQNVVTNEMSENNIYIGLENIESDTGKYIPTTEKNTISSANIFKKGQILFPKLRPYLNKVYLAEFDGICSTEFHVLNANDRFLDEFLAIYLRLNIIVNQTKHLMTGNTLPRLQTQDIYNLPVPIISIEKQREIVSIYNRANNNKLKKEQEAQALLNSIDDSLMKELGIELPEVDNSLQSRVFKTDFSNVIGNRLDPYGYLKKFKYLVDAIAQSKYPSKPLKTFVVNSCSGNWGEEPDSLQADIIAEYTICTVIRGTEFNHENIGFDDKKNKQRAILTERLIKFNIKEFDFLIEKSGGSEKQPVGRIGLITSEILSSQKICFSNFLQKFTINLNDINPYYLFFYLRFTYSLGITENMQSQTNGIRNLILKEYFDQKIIIPPIKKQDEIIAHIRSIRKQAKQLQNEAQQQFEEAKKEIERIILGENE